MVKKVEKIKKGKIDKCCSSVKGPCGGCAYFLGALGAAIYFISTATGFWMGVLGVLKALVWPVILVFEILKFLGV
tara:strand:+ start:22593 stop:22817 length:225 start_codon:yes stop_codon:yes gene_type:complete